MEEVLKHLTAISYDFNEIRKVLEYGKMVHKP